MKPKEPVETGQHDIFRSRLDQILNMGLEKLVLAGAIDRQFLSEGLHGQGWPSAAFNPIPLGDYAITCRLMVENVWQYLRQNRLSNRVFEVDDTTIDAACEAWNKLLA